MNTQATSSTLFMPEGVSTFSADVDGVFYEVYWICLFFFVLIVGLMVFFLIRYRRRSETETTPHISHNNRLEIAWTVGPIFLLVIIFFRGFDAYMNLRVPPRDAMEIHVSAARWQWTFTYADGTVTQELGVPVDQPIKLVMSSQDVIHSFYLPHFRQKMDVVPNRYTTTWFQGVKTGTFPIFCAEYCGTSHSGMLSKVHVMEREAFAEWLLTGGLGDVSNLTLIEQGELYYRKFGCITCHSVDGSVKTGPTLKGIFGHEVALTGGRSAVVDENYIRKSLMEPAADVVAGFQPVMTPFVQLKDEQVLALIEFIKSLE